MLWSTDPEVLFLGSVDRRLAHIVADLNREQREKDDMASPQLQGLAAALRDLKALSSNAAGVSADVARTLADGGGMVARVKQLHTEIKTALAEVNAELGQITNGGPPLDDTFPVAVKPAPPTLPDAGQRGDPPMLGA